MFTIIDKCRISGSREFVPVLSLGEQYLTGVFPSSRDQKITKGPVDLVWCPDSGLLQLKQSYDLKEMYGDHYGYRSSLNASMVRHLSDKANALLRITNVNAGDHVLDIGSNDATFLKFFPPSMKRVGMDPTGAKFSQYYQDVELIPDFFSVKSFHAHCPGVSPKIITSIAMFYDLEDPVSFVNGIKGLLYDEGIWHFEQSYMPSMLQSLAYDTICQEHLEYYSFRNVKELLERCGLRVMDVQLNSVNGGSFAVTAVHQNSGHRTNHAVVDWLLHQEKSMKLDTIEPYRDFAAKVFRHRDNLRRLLDALVRAGKKIVGYGASTKGNVLLQFCGITSRHLQAIAEVNSDKFGCFTPGTLIPIVSEAEAKAMKPDYMLVLPWHFKANIMEREKKYLESGGRLIFPLPEIEII